MTTTLAGAMRAAADLTRAQRLAEATRIIQEALSGRAPIATPSADEPETMRRAIAHHVIDLKADVIEPGLTVSPEPQTDARAATRPLPNVAAFAAGPAGRLAETLRQSGMPQINLEGLAGRRARKPIEVADGAQFLSRTFSSAAGQRHYKLYIPRRLPDADRKLVVMLHGGTQDADDFAAGTRMNEVAEEHGCIVAYPIQPHAANASLCWNWFRPEDQMRGRGEPSILAGITSELITAHDIDPKLVFVAGLSAGGAMAEVMGATYPELYAGIGVHSGLAYGSAADVVSAFAAMRGEPGRQIRHRQGAKRSRTIVFHGDADKIVHPSNAAKIVGAHEKDHVRVEHPRCAHSASRPFTRTVTRDRDGVAVVEHWVVHGSGHAWSGGSADGSYTDPHGPDASREMLRFFLEAPKPGPSE